MIVKTFVGESEEEIREKIAAIYGPDLIVLTTDRKSEGEVEITFGIEEQDLLDHLQGDEKQDYPSDDTFWEAETIPGHEEL